MKLAILIVCLAAPAIAQDAVGGRIAQSAAAAERLQGSLDGAWTLRDGAGRTLYVIQIGDPPSGGPLSCAWRKLDGTVGLADCRRSGRRLTIALDAAGQPHAAFRQVRAGAWRGELVAGGASRGVSLRRG